MKGFDKGQRPALLISEVQNQITNIAYSESPLTGQVIERGIVSKINSLAEEFRARDLPVIHCTIAANPGFVGWISNCVLAANIKKAGVLVKGSRAAAIHDDLVVAASDLVSERAHGMSAFTGTELDSLLRGLGVSTVVFTGVSTNVAIPGGSTEAVNLGYDVVVPEDCAAGATAEVHQMQITNNLNMIATITDSAALIEQLPERVG